MKLAAKLGRASSESSAVDTRLMFDIKGLWLDNRCWNTFLIAESYINTPYRGDVE